MKKICNMILSYVLIMVIVLTVILLAPQIFGYRIYSVISGSMEPTLHVGSLVVAKKTEPSKIKIGDIITFTIAKNRSVSVTHRVVGIDSRNKSFKTKGDSNPSIDGPAKFENLVGRIVFCIPYLGFFAVYIKTKAGMLLVAVFLMILLIITIHSEILKTQKFKPNKNGNKGDI